MAYDDKGRWIYNDHETDVFRPRAAQRISAALSGAGKGCAALLLVGALAAGCVGLAYGSWYLTGRAVGAGFQDGRR